MEARSIAKYIRISPRKARQVVDLIRGRSVEEAINLLHFTPKASSGPVEKTLRSAVANALNKEEGSKLNPEDLFIKEIKVDEGPTMRRYRPGPMGRAHMIRKRMCHITIIVSDLAVQD
jgi:large subunit ribosomal protein L22